MDTDESFDTLFRQIQFISRERRHATGKGFAVREAMEWAYRAGLAEGKVIQGACQVCADVTPVQEPEHVVVVDANSAGSRLSRVADDATPFGYLQELA